MRPYLQTHTHLYDSKEPNFIVKAYQSWKDKVCFKIEFYEPKKAELLGVVLSNDRAFYVIIPAEREETVLPFKVMCYATYVYNYTTKEVINCRYPIDTSPVKEKEALLKHAETLEWETVSDPEFMSTILKEQEKKL